MRRSGAVILAVVLLAGCSGGSADPSVSAGPTRTRTPAPSVDPAVVRNVFAAARTTFEAVGTIDYGDRIAWARRVQDLVTFPFENTVREVAEKVLQADRGPRDRDLLSVDDVSLTSLRKASAVVLVTFTRTSVKSGRKSVQRDAVANELDLVNGRWLLGVEGYSGNAGLADQTFATSAERAAMDAALGHLSKLASISSRDFDDTYGAAKRVLTGDAERALPAAGDKRRMLVKAGVDLISDVTADVGLRVPGASDITLIGAVDYKFQEYATPNTGYGRFVYRMTMTRSAGRWLISDLRQIAEVEPVIR